MKIFFVRVPLALLILMSLLLMQCKHNEIEEQFDCSTSDLSGSAQSTESGCASASATVEVTATGGLPPYQYKLDDDPGQTSAIFNDVEPGLYQITITDANSCVFVVNQVVRSTTSYVSDIEPIIMNSCAVTGCHDGSSAQTNLTTLAAVQANAADIKSFTQTGFMPRNGTLTDQEIALITCWVDDGALDN